MGQKASLMSSFSDRLEYLNVFKSHVSIKRNLVNLNWTKLELYRSFQANEKVNEASTESQITEIDADAEMESTKVMLTIVQGSMCSIMY